MKILTTLSFAFFFSSAIFSQTTSDVKPAISFEEYCELEAIYFITAPAEKLNSIDFVGERELLSEANASYIDYDVKIKEGENQYYKLIGSEEILVVRSQYILRLNYENVTK
ncbi:MAG: hypothetical protein QNK23_06940 [Crocinitomicaceae bacterium]|nr:hypothetical protein [Crocinitomicaceae bacterium]